jgi:hypothetical protein
MACKCNAVIDPGFYSCFWVLWMQVGGVSLNRYEQTLYDYVKSHPDERQYWQDKVRALVADSIDTPAGVARVDSELWRYFEERSAVLPSFGGTERQSGLRRTSMKSLAELLIRLWTDVKTRKADPSGPDSQV